MMFTVGKTQFTQLFKEFANYTVFTHHACTENSYRKKKGKSAIKYTDHVPIHSLKSNETLFCNRVIIPSEFAAVKPAVVLNIWQLCRLRGDSRKSRELRGGEGRRHVLELGTKKLAFGFPVRPQVSLVALGESLKGVNETSK